MEELRSRRPDTLFMTQTGATEPGSEARHRRSSSWILPSAAQPSWDTAGKRTSGQFGFGTYDDEARRKWVMGKRSGMFIPSMSLAFLCLFWKF